MRRYIPIIIGLVVVAGWFLTRPSDEKKITARFEALSQNISKGSEDSESIANMAFRAHQLGSLLAERVDLATERNELNGTYSSEEFSAQIFSFRGMFKIVKLQFHDLQIVVDGEAASVIGTAQLDLTSKLGERAAPQVREVNVQLKKIDNKWRFESFKKVQVLKK